jgi:leucyl-tRNA---protein transferase
MTLPSDPPLQKLQFYATTPYSCGYIAGRLAQSLIAAPHHLIDSQIYSSLVQQGFRRSGKFTYRPHCENCNACVPVRLAIDSFKPTRSQKRALRTHSNLQAEIIPLQFSEEHYQLYSAYQSARHAGKDELESAEQYRNFLVQSHVESLMVEFRFQGQLKIVSVIDILQDGLSAVYTFYDTADLQASYGTYSIMWLVEWCKTLDLPYLYLGYWIKDSPKMAYKQNFQPQQALVDGEWQTLEIA